MATVEQASIGTTETATPVALTLVGSAAQSSGVIIGLNVKQDAGTADTITIRIYNNVSSTIELYEGDFVFTAQPESLGDTGLEIPFFEQAFVTFQAAAQTGLAVDITPVCRRMGRG